MSAIGSVYVVGKVRLSPTVNLDRGAGAGFSRGYSRGSLCRRAPPCPTWAMAAADRSWVTTPIPVRPPDTTIAAVQSVVKEGYVYCFVYCGRSDLGLDILS